MRKFVVMAVAARLVTRCGHKRCIRGEWIDRWYDYMFSVQGRERLERHMCVLARYFSALNAGMPALIDRRELLLT